MPLLDLHEELTVRTRRWFGVSLAAVIVLLGWLTGELWAWSLPIAIAVGVAVLIVYYFVPALQVPIIRGWQLVTFPLAWLVGHVLLATVYFLLFTPIGLILRLTGRDTLRLNKPRGSLWTSKGEPPPPDRYFRQH